MILNDILFDGAKGKSGSLIVRKVRGRVYLQPVAPRSRKKRKSTAATRKFHEAVHYASTQMKDPVSKSEYETGITAKKNNAHLVALTDYLNAPEVSAIETKFYEGEKGDMITVWATDDFMVIGVRVAVISKSGSVLEEGEASPLVTREDWWRYNATVLNRNLDGTVIRATAYDKAGNATMKEVVVGGGATASPPTTLRQLRRASQPLSGGEGLLSHLSSKKLKSS